MTDQSAQEPTMEEILASIRRIISEDEAPAETGQATSAPADEPAFAASEPETFAAEPVQAEEAPPVQQAAPVEDDDVLDLTDRYEAPPVAETIGDLDVSAAPEPAPEPEPEPQSPAAFSPAPEPTPEPAPVTQTNTDDLVGASAAASAASAFAGLTASLKMPNEGRSLEDLVKEMMRPMLKDWLDANLPGIVEAQVRSEVERIARQGGR